MVKGHLARVRAVASLKAATVIVLADLWDTEVDWNPGWLLQK
jgi:hypothetical protein